MEKHEKEVDGSRSSARGSSSSASFYNILDLSSSFFDLDLQNSEPPCRTDNVQLVMNEISRLFISNRGTKEKEKDKEKDKDKDKEKENEEIAESCSIADGPTLEEKSLSEMGIKPAQGLQIMIEPPKENLSKLLRNMIENHIKPDVTIRISGFIFRCQMLVLKSYSPFFMGFKNEVLIQLPDDQVTPNAFLLIYEWMLADQPQVQREGIIELFNAANFLQIQGLVDQCWTCLDNVLCFCEDTAFLLYKEARLFKLRTIEQLMLSRICKFFMIIVAAQDFLDLNIEEVCALLTLNTIGVNSECEVFLSAVRWLDFKWEERKEHMLEVLKCVRFGLMPPWFLVALDRSGEYAEIGRITDDPDVKVMITTAMPYATSQSYTANSRAEFIRFLQQCEMTLPAQRQWVFDKNCHYHHRMPCPKTHALTYKSFLQYLEQIQQMDKNHWQTFEMAGDMTSPCCSEFPE